MIHVVELLQSQLEGVGSLTAVALRADKVQCPCARACACVVGERGQPRMDGAFRYLRGDGDIELVGEAKTWQAQLHPLGFLESDAHVFWPLL